MLWVEYWFSQRGFPVQHGCSPSFSEPAQMYPINIWLYNYNAIKIFKVCWKKPDVQEEAHLDMSKVGTKGHEN